MLSKEKKNECLERVVASDTFKNAPTSIALLRYLVQANIEKKFLKEGIIDMEFFGTSPEESGSNPRVRVNIYNLRKKLKSYYAREGADDRWHLKIDKGQYSLRFEKQSVGRKLKALPSFWQLLPYLLLLISLLALLLSHLPNRKPVLWKAFFTNGQPTKLFIGDSFGYTGQTLSGQNGWTRDFSINNLDEYYDMLERRPELKAITKPSDYFYSTRMAENATHDLSRLFTRWKRDFEIKYTTTASFSDIKKGNTIYVGSIKNQQTFSYLFNEANPYFKIQDKQIRFSGHPQRPDTSFATNSPNTEFDYALVSRIPGPDGTEQFLFFSNHDIGVMATVEFFTHPDSLRAFSRRHLNDTPYFTALYQARGKERTSLKLEEVMVVAD